MRTLRRVVVTGLGLQGPWGRDPDALFDHLLAGDSAVALYAPPDAPTRLALPSVRCADFDAEATLGRPLAMTMDRYCQLGVAAALDAWRDAGLGERAEAEADPRYGVSWGTALGGTLTFERGYRELFIAGRQRVSPLSVVLGMVNAAASHIGIQLRLGGACLTYSIACASSATAIGEGARRIRCGEADVVVAGGSEAPLSYGILRAWEAMRVLAGGDEHTAHRACRPFSADRAGLVLGEGGAALVLEDYEHAHHRGARILAELAGYGSSCDASHLVRPDAGGQARAIQAALADAGLTPADIDYVNAHGTATPEGDPVEIQALRQVFGEHAARLPVSATKSMHGHQLGATGALEALIAVLALRRGRCPPTAHLAQVAVECQGVAHLLQAQAMPLRHILSNAFAFGGSNAALILKAADAA